MIRNRTTQKAVALFLVPLMLGGAGLISRDGLADDAQKPKGRGPDPDRPGVATDAAGDNKQASSKAPAPDPKPAPAPAGKDAPAARKAPPRKAAARNAPPPAENPDLDREILDAINQGPFGFPAGPPAFQGMINVNGQTRQFNNVQGFNNAMGPMPRMGMPGMPGGGLNIPGMVPMMPLNPLLFPARPGPRPGGPRRAAATPKRRQAARKAAPKAETPREKAAIPDPRAPKPAEEEFPSDGI